MLWLCFLATELLAWPVLAVSLPKQGFFSGKYKFFELLFRDRVRLLQQGGFLPDFSSLLLKIYLLVN